MKKNECHQIILTDAVNWLTKQLFPNLSSLFASHYKKAGRLFSSAASLLQVGAAFQELTARQELSTIGSTPSKEHVFKVDNFAALSSIQKLLQEKIFAVEGKGE